MLNREDILHEEKLSLLLFMKYKKCLSVTESAGKIKNASDSKKRRELGNELYKSKPHDSFVHKEILHYYSQSIALAPNASEDLALGYGNRSALFFHIKKYKECMIDIDRALSITSNSLLKVRLLCRKAESLLILNQSAKFVCEEGLQILEQCQESKRSVYAAKLNKLIKENKTIKSDIKLSEKNSFNVLLNFERSKEIPSATKSVALKYDKKWGHHIVATEYINPGEIISVQKCCFTHIGLDVKCLYCSYCTIIAYNSLPCDFCIQNIYCSEACKSKAWEEYHQYECILYQHTKELNNSILCTKFVLSAVHEVGSIEQIKEYILEIENTTDPRIKGFSNGVFNIEQKQSLYCFNKICEENLEYNEKYTLISDICNCVYILAKFTNFFGQKTNILEPELLFNEDRLFIAALILRTAYIFKENSVQFSLEDKEVPEARNFYIELFTNLINHSCHNNVKTIRLNGGKNITFACHPIKKGSQLFKNVKGLNFFMPKEVRQNVFKDLNITCGCIACTEDWSSISVPSIQRFFEITPTLDVQILRTSSILLSQTDPQHGFSRFTQNLLNHVCHHLAELAEKFTVVCHEYYMFLHFIENLLDEVFSENFFKMPTKCE